MLVRFFIVALILSTPVRAYTKFTEIDWKTNSIAYQSMMSLQIDKAMSVAFIKNANETLKLKLSSPYLINNAVTASLYQIHSPMQQPTKKLLTDEVSLLDRPPSSTRKDLIFTKKINALLAGMGSGDWALIELHLNNDRVQKIMIPAINFSQKLQTFYASINTLPPLSWQNAKHFTVHFDLSEDQLSQQEKINLSRLVSTIRYDARVKKITIDGHTDQSGNRLNNMTLSQRRGQHVKDYLVELGLDASLIKTLRHHGERYPIKGAKPEENRRVEIRLFRIL